MAFLGAGQCARLARGIDVVELGVEPGDVRVLLAQLGRALRGRQWRASDPWSLGGEIRDQLDHVGGTVPAVWWPGSDPDASNGATWMR